MVTKERLDELFIINKEGIIIRKKNVSNTKIGDNAGSLHKSTGYLRLNIDNKSYYVHRLIYFYFTGIYTSEFEIDHINRNRLDNRLENLRLVTTSQNQCNVNFKGYHKQKDGKFRVRLSIEGNRITIGYYNTEKEAKEAVIKAKDKYYNFNEVGLSM